jgi:hypothetical protein
LQCHDSAEREFPCSNAQKKKVDFIKTAQKLLAKDTAFSLHLFIFTSCFLGFKLELWPYADSMRPLEGNLDLASIGTKTIIDSSFTNDPSPHSTMTPTSHSSSPHLNHQYQQQQRRVLSNVCSSIEIPFDTPITPPIPSDEQMDAITDKILHLNVKDIANTKARSIVQPSYSTDEKDMLSRPLPDHDAIIDYSAAPMTQEWSALEEHQFIPLHSEDNDSLITYPSFSIASDSWHAEQLKSLNQYLSNTTTTNDSSNSVASLPQHSADHYAWLNVPPNSSSRHILPLPVPKWRRKGFKSSLKSRVPMIGPRAAKNCIASPDRAARMVLASMKAYQTKCEKIVTESSATSVSAHDFAPHRDKIKKMKRTIGSDEIKSDVEERRLHGVTGYRRRRLHHQQQRFIRNTTTAFNTELQQKLKEVRLPESAFDFSYPFQLRHKFQPLPPQTLDPAAPKSSIGLIKCLEQIPYHSMKYNNRRSDQQSLATQSDKQAISTTTVASARPHPPSHRQKGPSRKASHPPAIRNPTVPTDSTGARPRRNNNKKTTSNTTRSPNHRKEAEYARPSLIATEVLPATSLLFDHGTSDDWMCWFCEFEVFVRGFVAARRKGGWYKRRRERNQRLREIEARQNNELISSSGSELDDLDPV